MSTANSSLDRSVLVAMCRSVLVAVCMCSSLNVSLYKHVGGGGVRGGGVGDIYPPVHFQL